MPRVFQLTGSHFLQLTYNGLKHEQKKYKQNKHMFVIATKRRGRLMSYKCAHNHLLYLKHLKALWWLPYMHVYKIHNPDGSQCWYLCLIILRTIVTFLGISYIWIPLHNYLNTLNTMTHPGIKFWSFYHYPYQLVHTKPIPIKNWYEVTCLRPFQ